MPNQRSVTHRLVLSDKLINVARPHALGQRHRRGGCFLSVVIKDVHKKFLTLRNGIFVIRFLLFVIG
jgi:hypothetical protein